ncbi:MAG: hypothetical protein OJF49_000209 [Ktedonobacterales bacterium]|jgi:hypothetical protein|nr:MAG: hypothetical protein OJF49_000209 [Ktedonobacterales bacterium]
MKIPERFGEAFLDWFRIRTEEAWSSYQPRSFEDFVASRVGGLDWQQGTRWLSGLSEDEVDQVERQWALRFPADYRLFLRHLHAVDRPMRGARYSEYVEGGEESHLVPWECPSFYNWLTDTEELRAKFEWLVEGLEFDVEHDARWPASWGAKPETPDAQKGRVRELVAAAPRLIPVFAHRYLLAEPCQAGNPVLSVWQSDIIVYGADLRSYLLFEFADLLGLDREALMQERAATAPGNTTNYAEIPFWGEFLCGFASEYTQTATGSPCPLKCDGPPQMNLRRAGE